MLYLSDFLSSPEARFVAVIVFSIASTLASSQPRLVSSLATISRKLWFSWKYQNSMSFMYYYRKVLLICLFRHWILGLFVNYFILFRASLRLPLPFLPPTSNLSLDIRGCFITSSSAASLETSSLSSNSSITSMVSSS